MANQNQTEVEKESVETYYPMTSELKAKADQFGCATRKRYILKENNPFGYRAGLAITGTGLRAAISATVLNFMNTYDFRSDNYGKAWNDMYDYIKTVVIAIAKDTVVSATGTGYKGTFETEYDVKESTSAFLFDDFFYDEKKKQIFRYE
jgi:hypothetical protein